MVMLIFVAGASSKAAGGTSSATAGASPSAAGGADQMSHDDCTAVPHRRRKRSSNLSLALALFAALLLGVAAVVLD